MSGFSGILFTCLIMKPTLDTIDTIKQLAEKGIEFSVFQGENADEFVNDLKETYYEELHPKCNVEDIENDIHEQWNEDIVQRISKGNYALVTDQTFLDYLLAKYSKSFPNLYRSSISGLILPYFLLLAKHTPKHFIISINKM